MANHKVSLTIDLMGNAVKGVGGLAARIGKIGLGLHGVISSFSAIKGKLEEFSAANNMQQEAEAKLAQVMKNTMNAGLGEVAAIKKLASAQQQLGVIGDEVQLAGAQELGTYLSKKESLERLMPVMNDMLAQQYGLNASQEQAVQIGSMIGKVMDGQTGALSRYGYKFDEVQKKILETGTEEQRVATLVDVISASVGGMNEALAATPEGRIRQMENRLGDMKEKAGSLFTQLKVAAMPLMDVGVGMLENLMPVVTKIVEPIERGVQRIMAFIGQIKPVVDRIYNNSVLPLVETVKNSVGNLLTWLQPVVDVFWNNIVPAVENVFGVVTRIVGKIVEFVSNSILLRNIFKWIMKLCGKVYDIISDVFSAVEWLFNKIILPALQTIEKVYRKITGQTDEATRGQRSQKPMPKANVRLMEAVNGGGGRVAGGTAGSGGGKATVESVATGGSRSTSVTINLKSLVEKMVFEGGLGESRSEMERQVSEVLLRVLNMAQASVS